MNINKGLIVILIILLVSSLVDCVRMGIAIEKVKDIVEPEMIMQITNQIRLETIQIVIILGVFLLYLQQKGLRRGKS